MANMRDDLLRKTIFSKHNIYYVNKKSRIIFHKESEEEIRKAYDELLVDGTVTVEMLEPIFQSCRNLYKCCSYRIVVRNISRRWRGCGKMTWLLVGGAIVGIAWCLRGSISLRKRDEYSIQHEINDIHYAQFHSMNSHNHH